MFDLSTLKSTQRVGELVVAGPSFSLQKKFISHLCQEVINTSGDTLFGRSRITDELFLFFYGIGEKNGKNEFSWDLLVPKMLGCIILFPWQDQSAFRYVQHFVNTYSARYDTHAIIAGDMASSSIQIPTPVYEQSLSLSSKLYFTLWNSSAKSSTRNVVKILVDSIINHLQ